jgi:membrane protein DedA with SNARE-associated domain
VAQAIWDVLDSVATGGILWLSFILVLAFLGELGLPFTAPVLESLLVYTGFRMAGGAALIVSAPFLAFAFVGRLIGSHSAYQLSRRLGLPLIERFGHRLGVTPRRVATLKHRLTGVLTPTIILARFTPGFSVLTTIVCGASRVRRGQFVAAVIGQLFVWEAAFLGAGAVAGLASRSLSPDTYPHVLIVTICIAITLGTVAGYVVFQRVKSPAGRATSTSRA